jgi:mRNA interferase MazF
MVIERGEIWWTELPEPTGSQPGYRRPVLVIQSEVFNRSRIPTVIVAAMTTNLRLAQAPGNVPVTAHQSGLPRDSVVNVSQLLTVNQTDLDEPVGRLSESLMVQVDEGLR